MACLMLVACGSESTVNSGNIVEDNDTDTDIEAPAFDTSTAINIANEFNLDSNLIISICKDTENFTCEFSVTSHDYNIASIDYHGFGYYGIKSGRHFAIILDTKIPYGKQILNFQPSDSYDVDLNYNYDTEEGSAKIQVGSVSLRDYCYDAHIGDLSYTNFELYPLISELANDERMIEARFSITGTYRELDSSGMLQHYTSTFSSKIESEKQSVRDYFKIIKMKMEEA